MSQYNPNAKRRDPAYHRMKSKEWQKKHPEKCVAATKAWRHKNAEYVAAKRREYQTKHRKRINANHVEFMRTHPKSAENCRRLAREWRAANLELSRAYARHRKAKLKGNSQTDWRGIVPFMNRLRKKKVVYCYYCGTKLKGRDAHVDHVVPISKGGPHAVSNFCVACPTCNIKKKDKPIREVVRNGQQFLGI